MHASYGNYSASRYVSPMGAGIAAAGNAIGQGMMQLPGVIQQATEWTAKNNQRKATDKDHMAAYLVVKKLSGLDEKTLEEQGLRPPMPGETNYGEVLDNYVKSLDPMTRSKYTQDFSNMHAEAQRAQQGQGRGAEASQGGSVFDPAQSGADAEEKEYIDAKLDLADRRMHKRPQWAIDDEAWTRDRGSATPKPGADRVKATPVDTSPPPIEYSPRKPLADEGSFGMSQPSYTPAPKPLSTFGMDFPHDTPNQWDQWDGTIPKQGASVERQNRLDAREESMQKDRSMATPVASIPGDEPQLSFEEIQNAHAPAPTPVTTAPVNETAPAPSQTVYNGASPQSNPAPSPATGGATPVDAQATPPVASPNTSALAGSQEREKVKYQSKDKDLARLNNDESENDAQISKLRERANFDRMYGRHKLVKESEDAIKGLQAENAKIREERRQIEAMEYVAPDKPGKGLSFEERVELENVKGKWRAAGRKSGNREPKENKTSIIQRDAKLDERIVSLVQARNNIERLSTGEEVSAAHVGMENASLIGSTRKETVSNINHELSKLRKGRAGLYSQAEIFLANGNKNAELSAWLSQQGDDRQEDAHNTAVSFSRAALRNGLSDNVIEEQISSVVKSRGYTRDQAQVFRQTVMSELKKKNEAQSGGNKQGKPGEMF